MRLRRRLGGRPSWGTADADGRWFMLSPRSRGKGSRRFPGRDGGRGKHKVAQWRKQATHAVDDLSVLPGALAALTYWCRFGQSPAEAIYRFDQQIAGTGIRYHAELHGARTWHFFTVHVPAESAERVQAIISRVQR